MLIFYLLDKNYLNLILNELTGDINACHHGTRELPGTSPPNYQPEQHAAGAIARIAEEGLEATANRGDQEKGC